MLGASDSDTKSSSNPSVVAHEVVPQHPAEAGARITGYRQNVVNSIVVLAGQKQLKQNLWRHKGKALAVS